MKMNRIRLLYALDQAQYAVACDLEASYHYDIPISRRWQIRCFVRGLVNGLTAPCVPAAFVDALQRRSMH